MATAPTANFARDQRRAAMNAKSTQDGVNHNDTQLLVSDDLIPQYKIYVYNILSLDHTRNLPPNYSAVKIPACLPNEKYSFTTLNPAVRNRFLKPGTFDYYYQMEDGRKSASQIINPASFPSINFDRQLVQNSTEIEYEVSGSNLNDLGVWWSLTRPQDTEQLDREIALFRERVKKTMTALAKLARQWGSDPKKVHEITPRMHFAMDYLGLKAPWHTDTYAIVNCPTCGEEVRQGIVYHRNSLGDRCIVDMERAQKMGLAPMGDLSTPEKREPAMVSTNEFAVEEIVEEKTPEQIRDEENEILTAGRLIIEKRQRETIEKRRATIEANKKRLHSDPTAKTQDIDAAANEANAPNSDPPKKGSE